MGWAMAQPMNLRTLWGVASGPAGPVYFGVEADGRFHHGAFETYLDGRLLLGVVPHAEGRAGVVFEPSARFSVRAGYDGWFAGLPVEPRSLGMRSDYELYPGVTLSTAYTVTSRRFGLGLGYSGGRLNVHAWARNDGWLLNARLGGPRLQLRAWYAARWLTLASQSAGVEVRAQRVPWSAAAGYSSAWGWRARLGWKGPAEFWVAGRYRLARVSLAQVGVRWPLASGVRLDARLEHNWQPFYGWAARLELQVHAYRAPVFQGE